jgi:hypothetical protein
MEVLNAEAMCQDGHKGKMVDGRCQGNLNFLLYEWEIGRLDAFP